jgi:hypothetical protein
MKGLFGKVMGVVAGLIAIFGVSVVSVSASVPNISGKSPLYLVHGKSINNSTGIICEHWSHSSHASHASHASHSSHSSGY